MVRGSCYIFAVTLRLFVAGLCPAGSCPGGLYPLGLCLVGLRFHEGLDLGEYSMAVVMGYDYGRWAVVMGSLLDGDDPREAVPAPLVFHKTS